MRAHDRLLALQLLEHLGHVVEAVRREPFVELDLEPPRLGQRLDRLDAAQVRAGEDAVDREPGEGVDEGVSLLSASIVDRPDAVVSLPLLAIAGAGVPMEKEAHTSSSTGSEASTARSRAQDRLSVAVASGTQRHSSTPSPSIGLAPEGSSIAQ